MRTEDWLKPLFIVIGIFAFVYFLMLMNDAAFFGSWDVSSVISVLPWLVALGMALLTITYVLRRR